MPTTSTNTEAPVAAAAAAAAPVPSPSSGVSTSWIVLALVVLAALVMAGLYAWRMYRRFTEEIKAHERLNVARSRLSSEDDPAHVTRGRTDIYAVTLGHTLPEEHVWVTKRGVLTDIRVVLSPQKPIVGPVPEDPEEGEDPRWWPTTLQIRGNGRPVGPPMRLDLLPSYRNIVVTELMPQALFLEASDCLTATLRCSRPGPEEQDQDEDDEEEFDPERCPWATVAFTVHRFHKKGVSGGEGAVAGAGAAAEE